MYSPVCVYTHRPVDTNSQAHAHRSNCATLVHSHLPSSSRLMLSFFSQIESHTHLAMTRHKSSLSRHVHMYGHTCRSTHMRACLTVTSTQNLTVTSRSPSASALSLPGLHRSRFPSLNTLLTQNLRALTSTSAEKKLLQTKRLPSGNPSPQGQTPSWGLPVPQHSTANYPRDLNSSVGI